MHPVLGQLARPLVGWVGPYRLVVGSSIGVAIQRMPLTNYFQVPNEQFSASLIKLFQFFSELPVRPL